MSDTSSNYSEDAPLPEVTYAVGVETEVPGTHGQLHKTVLVEGDGTKPMNGSKVTVHYVGTLLADGSKFDSSRDRSEPFEFTIGKGQVIKGWDQGVATMRIGEKANLKCAPEYAYGAAGSPPKIPANSTLMFEVELFGWTKSEDVSETKDRSLMKATRVEGKGFDRAEYEAEATIDVATVVAAGPTEDGEVLMEKKDWAVVVGETVLPAGLEAALKSFIEGETAAVDVAGHLVSADDAEWKLAKGQAARYVITVKALKVVKPYTFDKAVKLDEAKKRKDQGNAYFKAQDWARAAAKYRRALEFVEYDTALEDSSSEGATLKVTVFNNLAQVELSQGNYPECIAQCDQCLAVQPKNPKAHFRRGKARAALGDWEEAKEDFNGILAEDPTNGDVQRELAAVQEKLRKHRQKEKAAFGNMFAKMAAMEEREHPTEKSAEPAQEEAKEEAKEE